LLKRLVGRVAASGRDDGELLERFVCRRDEAAFEALLSRHGPMVLGVCRRVLGNGHDAEDAFQAVFLVLARKAGSVRPPSRVGGWLHGVARRTALEARRAAAVRRTKEAKAVPHRNGEHDQALGEALDLELAGLPEAYREVIVLSDLEGRTRKEVAGLLGCPEGTVASRLARARAALAVRLARHGLTGTDEVERASVPLPLSAAALKGAMSFAEGAAGEVPARLVALAEEVIRIMFTKKTTKAALLLLVSLLATGVVLTSSSNAARQSEVAAEERKEAKGAPKAADDKASEDGELKKLQGVWRDRSNPESVWVITHDKVFWNLPGEGWNLKIDAAKRPKAFDITEGANRILGVYEVKGDTLRVRMGGNGGPRPTGLMPAEEVSVLKRLAFGEATTAVVSTDVEKTYQQNDALADERFTGKQVTVLGVVDRVRKHPAGYALVLTTVSAGSGPGESPPHSEGAPLMFLFAESARKDLAKLKKSQIVIVKGRCKGRGREWAGKEFITFSDCKVIKALD
jgi:RNA polymerase sigma-70 factor (ECF subfamily)